MDPFSQSDAYAGIGNETGRRKACPPRLPVRILSGKLQSQDKGHAMPLIRRGEFHR